MMTRPLFLRAAGLIIAGLLNSTSALQAAEQPELQAPYYRMRLGAFEITALSDGTKSVNGYLIDTGKQLVLIDTGAGILLGPGVGKLVGNLRAAGYEPEQVNEIYITRLQPAQIGGLLWERKAAFPNAIVRASRADADYWLAKSSMTSAPVEERQTFAEVAAALKPYLLAGRLKTFDDEVELVPGVRALPSAGQVPGNTAFAAQSGHEKMVFWGDTLVVAASHVQDPSLATRVEMNPATAFSKSTALFKDVATRGWWVAAANLPFPGIGHLRTDGHGYKFVTISHDLPYPVTSEERSSGSLEAARP